MRALLLGWAEVVVETAVVGLQNVVPAFRAAQSQPFGSVGEALAGLEGIERNLSALLVNEEGRAGCNRLCRCTECRNRQKSAEHLADSLP